MTQPNTPIPYFIGSMALQVLNKEKFLTTARFSETAIKTDGNSNQQKIILIDGKQFANLALFIKPVFIKPKIK